MVPVLQSQLTGRRGAEQHPPRPMPVVVTVRVALVEITVVAAVVSEPWQAGHGLRTIHLHWLYDVMVVLFWNHSLVCAWCGMK